MTTEDFHTRVKVLLQTAQIELPIINVRLAQSALALVRDRIINTGVDAKGNSLGKYSTNPLPTFFFLGKNLGSGAEKRIEAIAKKNRKAGIIGVTYEQAREANNLQTSHVDLKFSGDMWRDIQVLDTTMENGVYATTIASKNSISKKNGTGTVTTGEITDYMALKYGNFLEMNPQEEQIIAEALNEEIQNLIQKVFT